MNTEKSNIYSLTGFFVEDHTPREQVMFGGFFSARTNPHESRDNVLAEPFNGLLTDVYGNSAITGEISQTDLKFRKQYAGRRSTINYEFTREGDLWIGKYSGDYGIGNGRAFARTNLDWAGMDMIVREAQNADEWAEGLVQNMIDKGMLKVVE